MNLKEILESKGIPGDPKDMQSLIDIPENFNEILQKSIERAYHLKVWKGFVVHLIRSGNKAKDAIEQADEIVEAIKKRFG